MKLRVVSGTLLAAMLEVAGRALVKTPLELLMQAIPAGFIIASIAWIRAALSNGEFCIVLALTYTIASASSPTSSREPPRPSSCCSLARSVRRRRRRQSAWL